MSHRTLLLPLLCTLAAAAAHAGVAEAVTDGAAVIPVNATVKLTFQCSSSPTGICHNLLVGDSGRVADRFSIPVGRTRVMYDVPESLSLCITDAPVSDASQCEARKLSELVAPLVRR